MRTKDPRYRRRETIVMIAAGVLVVVGLAIWPELSRRLLAWKITHLETDDARLAELAERADVMLPYVETYLADEDPGVRTQTLWAIASVQHPAKIPVLRRMAESPIPQVRQYGLDGLTVFGVRDIYGLLVRGLSDEDSGVRMTSIRCLLELTGKTFEYPASGEGKAEQRKEAADRWRSWLLQRQAGLPAGG